MKNKTVSEGKAEFVNVLGMEECIEEFSLEFNQEKAGLVLDSAK